MLYSVVYLRLLLERLYSKVLKETSTFFVEVFSPVLKGVIEK